MGKTSKIVLLCMMLLLVVLFQLLEQDLKGQVPLAAAPFKSTGPLAGSVRPERPPPPRRTAPQPAVGPAAHQLYEIKPGDVLSSIAGRFYGNRNRWRLIFDANRDRIEDPGRLQPGTRIRIPRLSEEG